MKRTDWTLKSYRFGLHRLPVTYFLQMRLIRMTWVQIPFYCLLADFGRFLSLSKSPIK